MLGEWPVIGGGLCIIGFLLTAYIIFQGEVEKSLHLESIESISRMLSAKGIGNAPHDAFIKSISKTGSLNSGLVHLKSALKLDPNNPQYNAELAAYYALEVSGRINTGLGADKNLISKGKAHAKLSIKHGGYRTMPQVALGMLLDNEGRHHDAQSWFSKAGQMGNPWHHVYMCTSYGLAGDYAKALNEIEQHNNNDLPGKWVVHQWRGRMLLRLGRYKDAESDLKQALRMRGACPGLALPIFEALFMQGRVYEANRYKIREAVILFTRNPKRSVRLIFEAMLLDAKYSITCISRFLTNLFRTRAFSHRILERIAPPYEPYESIANLAFTQGHTAEAHRLIQRALTYGDHVPDLWGKYSNILMALGRYDEATKACAKAISLAPNDDLWKKNAEYIEAVKSGNAPLRFFAEDHDGVLKEVNMKGSVS